jgi:class 3 adenylate cyclase
MPVSTVSSFAIQGRNACTPDVARALAKTWYDTDVRGLLPSVKTPTLLMVHEDREGSLEEARFIAGLMPNAEVRAMPGSAWTAEELPAWLGEMRRFVGGDLPSASPDTVLTTVLFTDIVDSTATQARIGDRAWRDLIEAHHAIVRRSLDRFGGLEQDTAGDGFYARFDGPARAIRCAREIGAAVRELGIEIRAGIHTGECEIADGKCAGLSVTIGARVMSLAGASEVLVSRTVKDLVAGSGFAFTDAGEHQLKGVPDRWRLYRVLD